MNTPWQFQLLGRLSARRGDQIVTRFATSRVAALFARLALFPQRSHSREELSDLLWPESTLESGKLNLRVALASLRRQLEPPDVPSGSILIADRSTLRLHPAAFHCDVLEFEAALKAARREASSEKRREALDKAVALFHGELLPGFYDDWIVEERERLNALFEDACRLRETLPETLPAVFTPFIPTYAPVPTLPGFPLAFTRFFGREEEITRIAGWLEDPQTRLVTLTGPGGSGKTRMAGEIARRVKDSFSGPLCFTALADLSDARLIPDAIAQTLGLTRSAEVEVLEQVIKHLNTLLPALLVLDNFEHLVEQGAPRLLSLLSRVPSLTCLVTSRRRLALPGERECPLPPLSLPAANGTLDEVARAASTQLFLDRAQAARPDFQITAGNASAVAALCRTLEGIPLALELAAARASALTPAQMNERLEQRFTMLISRRGDKGGRHRSLWAALAWSYDLLNPDLQRFFVRLSVFRGGGTVEAAQAVCEEPQALEYLTQLRERSLVMVEECRTEMRFRLLESLREFGEEQLENEAAAALSEQHAAWFQALAKEAAPQLTGQEQSCWLDRLEADHDNLRLALRFRLNADETVEAATEAALDMCGSLWRFWSTRGYYAEGRAWICQALARPGGTQATRARASNGAGTLARVQCDYPAAEAYYTEALAIMRELDWKIAIGACLSNLGMVAMNQEEYAQAQALHEEALTVRRELGDQNGIAFTLECQAIVAQHLKDYALSRRLHEESIALCATLKNDAGQMWALANLAEIESEENNLDTAAALLAEALALCLKLQDLHTLHSILGCIAHLTARRGDAVKAARLFGASEALRRRIGAGLSRKDAADLESLVADVKGSLSTSEFAAAWTVGESMSTEQAVAYALQ